MTSLLDRLDDGFDVERLDGSQVDDFGFDAVLLLELLGGDEGLADAAREGDDGEVLARALDLGLAELGVVSVLGSVCGWVELTGMTKSSFWASSLMGKERPYRSLSCCQPTLWIYCCGLFTRSPRQRPGWGRG